MNKWRTLAGEWQIFARVVPTPPFDDYDEVERERTFYSGALAMFGILQQTTQMDESEALEFARSVQHELTVFRASVMGEQP